LTLVALLLPVGFFIAVCFDCYWWINYCNIAI
jgi:hypothetical protein